MLIYILDDNMKKIDLLRKYTFVQYVNKFRDIGTFTVHAQLVDENLYILDRTKDYFILFDNEVFGKIEAIKESDDFEYEKTIEITGRLAKYILTKRVINGTIKYKGNTAGYIKALIEREFVQTANTKRKINITVEYENPTRLQAVCSVIERAQTGGYIWDEIKTYLEQDKLGLSIVPVVNKKHTVDGKDTNISQWKAIISAGEDRRQFNTAKNEVLLFSKSLSNIARTDYEKNVTEYRGTAYIAGEGEGGSRKWYEKHRPGEETKVGWNRNELWIDARDIQSEKEGSTEENPDYLTDEEYEALIDQRVEEKFSEVEKSESYSATMAKDKRLVYGKNVSLGDWGTVRDEQLGIIIDAQIIEATVSEQDSQRIIDLSVEYGKAKQDAEQVVKSLMQKVSNQESTINYLVNKKGGSSGGSGSGGGGTFSVSIGTVETLSPGIPAYVHNVGNENGAILNFGIPKGNTGEQGLQGIQGIQGIPGIQGNPGKDGKPGEKGEPGADGTPAGFGEINATVDNNVGIPSVTVSTAGTNAAKDITFHFHNLKGKPGENASGGTTSGCDCFFGGFLEQFAKMQRAIFGYDILVDDNGNPIVDEEGNMVNVMDGTLSANKVWGTSENGTPGWIDAPPK